MLSRYHLALPLLRRSRPQRVCAAGRCIGRTADASGCIGPARRSLSDCRSRTCASAVPSTPKAPEPSSPPRLPCRFPPSRLSGSARRRLLIPSLPSLLFKKHLFPHATMLCGFLSRTAAFHGDFRKFPLAKKKRLLQKSYFPTKPIDCYGSNWYAKDVESLSNLVE